LAWSRATALGVLLGDAGKHEVLVTAKRLQAAEQRFLLRVEASLIDIVFGDRRHEEHDGDTALERAQQAARDRRNRDGLILDVDRAARGMSVLSQVQLPSVACRSLASFQRCAKL